MEVEKLLKEGKTSREIAKFLELEETRINQIIEKLNNK